MKNVKYHNNVVAEPATKEHNAKNQGRVSFKYGRSVEQYLLKQSQEGHDYGGTSSIKEIAIPVHFEDQASVTTL